MKKALKNKFETRLYSQLKKSKIKFKYESEKIPYVFSGHYIPDFVLIDPRGNKVYIEAKGYLRPEHKRKMAAIKKLYPAMDLRIIFYSFNKKYVAWANKIGLPYAIKEIPAEWLL